jgi:hypothetical protein
MPTEVTDPGLLAQLNGSPQPVSDPAILAQLNATDPGTGSISHQLLRGAGLSANALAHGVVGAVDMIPDAMTAAYNFAKNPHIPKWEEVNPFSAKAWPSNTPTAFADRALNSVLPTPVTTPEKVASFGLGMEGGALVPNLPIPGAKAPDSFVSPQQQQAQRLAAGLKQAQDKGYVVPPSTTNPTLFNKTLETIGGKEATQNQARVLNQTARNTGAATDLGLKPEVFTPDAVAAVKQEAGQGFEAARAIPQVKTDPQYAAALDSVLKESHGSNASFPGSANPDIEKLVDIYRQPTFTGDAAVSAVKMLRSKASDAYRTGNSETGMAYKGLSNAIEAQLERGAQQAGGSYSDLVSQLRQARKTYAQASTVEDVMDPNGNVSGQKLAAALRRGEPLSGNLLQAAEHAANYPKANLPANSSNISHLNMYGGPLISLAAEHATGSPLGLLAGAALPVARAGSRAYLLSGTGQAGARPQMTSELVQALQKKFPNSIAGTSNPQ